jgi:hypothetical protein
MPGLMDWLRGLGNPTTHVANPNYGKDINLGHDSGVKILKGIPTHPSDIPETSAEKAIKNAHKFGIGSFLDNDLPYLEQYIHSDRDILDKQPLRPTIKASGKNENLDFRKPAYQDIEVPNAEAQTKMYSDFSSGRSKFNNNALLPKEVYRESDLHGLGRYKRDSSNPNYDSMYDVWDFNDEPLVPKGKILPSLDDIKTWGATKFLQRAGKPFAVYERYPKGEMIDGTPRVRIK